MLQRQQAITARVNSIIESAGPKGHVFNLGHGCTPETPVSRTGSNGRRATDMVAAHAEWVAHPGGRPRSMAVSHTEPTVCAQYAERPSSSRVSSMVLIRWRSKRSNLADMSTPCPSLTLIPQEASELRDSLALPFGVKPTVLWAHSIDSALSSTLLGAPSFCCPFNYTRIGA